MDAQIAAVVVAGDYEGAAIITWEHAQGAEKRVCYLDKFAVLKRSQGAGGVADVVFKSMVEAVQTGLLEAEGVVWRSRRWNPVNRWVCIKKISFSLELHPPHSLEVMED